MAQALGLEGDVPILYGVLGAEIYLEAMRADDAAALEAANELAWDWIGKELRQTWFSFYEGPVRTSRADLDYVPGLVRDLAKPKVNGPHEQRIRAAELVRFTRSIYSVMCNGGNTPAEASPFSYRFYSEMPNVGADSEVFTPLGVLNITVPETWPLADFAARVRELVAGLRVKWAVAGLSYSPWELVDPWPARIRTYAHSMRHPGYDVGCYVRFLEAWEHQIRSINWLTFLGPDLLAKLTTTTGTALQARGHVSVEQVGPTTLLVAGNRPEGGDRNHLQVPQAYREADALVRPIRAGEGIDFADPWDRGSTRDWLRRFELLLS